MNNVKSNFSQNLKALGRRTVSNANKTIAQKRAQLLDALHNDEFSFDEIVTPIYSANRAVSVEKDRSEEIPADEEADLILQRTLEEAAVDVAEILQEEVSRLK